MPGVQGDHPRKQYCRPPASNTAAMILDDAPLAGLRIIEVSSFVAAPLAGMTLAQLGAEVIRIDPLGGAPDTTRWPLAPNGGSLYWAGLNKGKRSVTLDLRSPGGQRAVAELIAASGPDGGIVLTNAAYPWLSYDALKDARPDLIHLRITGGGGRSPPRARPPPPPPWTTR